MIKALIFIVLAVMSLLIVILNRLVFVHNEALLLVAKCNSAHRELPNCQLTHMDIGIVTDFVIYDGSHYRCYYARSTGTWILDRPAWGGSLCAVQVP